MDINPQTREVSVEEWWAANHGSDRDVDEIGIEELLGMAESLGLTPSQMAEMGLLGANYRDRVEATRQLSTVSEALGQHFVRRAVSRSVENQTYGSNEEVYNPYNPQASTAYLAQEVAAGRREPAGLPQRSPRASRKPQELATGSLPRSSSRETIYPSSPRNDIFDWSEHGNALPLVTPDSDSSTEGSSGSHRSDALPYLFDDYPRSSPPLGRRVHFDAREAGPDSESEDQFRPDHAALASINEPEEHNLSFDYIRTPEMDHLRPQRARAPDLDARAKELVLGIASRIHTPSTATASTPTHQPANGAPGSAGLVDHDRKRRRTGRSPQEAVPPPPIPGAIGTARTAARQAFFAASDWPGRSRLRAEAPVFVPRSARTTSSPPLRGQPVDVGRIMLEHLRMNIDRHRSQQPPSAAIRQTSTAMFLPAHIPMRHLVFTSELIPASLGEKKRRTILNILRIKAPYVPACIAMPPMRPKIQYHISLKPKQNVGLSSSNRNNAPLGSNGQGWPVAPYGLPLEVFQNIAGYLPRSSLESMRLVSREFERNVSNVQFRRVVVPFRPEIYDIIDPRGPFLKVVDVKGKGKEKEKGRAEETILRMLLALTRISRNATEAGRDHQGSP